MGDGCWFVVADHQKQSLQIFSFFPLTFCISMIIFGPELTCIFCIANRGYDFTYSFHYLLWNFCMIFNKVLNNLPRLSLNKDQLSKKISYFESGSQAKAESTLS